MSGPFRKELFYEASTRHVSALPVLLLLAALPVAEAEASGPTAPTATAVVSCRDVARNDDDSAEPHGATTSDASHRRGDWTFEVVPQTNLQTFRSHDSVAEHLAADHHRR